MSLDKKLIDQFIDITSLAAIACYQHIGKENKLLADKAYLDNVLKDGKEKATVVADSVLKDIYDVIKKTYISGVSLSSILHYGIAKSFKNKNFEIGNLNYLENIKYTKKLSSNIRF